MKAAIVIKYLSSDSISDILEIEKGLKAIFNNPFSLSLIYFACDGLSRQISQNFTCHKLKADYKNLGTEEKIFSYAVLNFLKEKPFDFVIFLDDLDLGYYSVLCKKEGRGLASSKLIIPE